MSDKNVKTGKNENRLGVQPVLGKNEIVRTLEKDATLDRDTSPLILKDSMASEDDMAHLSHSMESDAIRFDLKLIASWIESGSKVLGLGCGEGELLHHLKRTKGVDATGIEIDESKVTTCIEKGLSVIQGDINEEIRDYPDRNFDYAVLSQTLQQVYQPEDLIQSMLRVAKRGVVSFPNFSHWRVRKQLLTSGHVPKTDELPYEWYNTPNIRVLSLKDFESFASQLGFSIIKEAAVNTWDHHRQGKEVSILPNLFATYGIFLIGKRGYRHKPGHPE